METIILASGSERRKEYFKMLGLPFISIPSPSVENYDCRAKPEIVAKELAIRKVESVVELINEKSPLWVFGADTVIGFNREIYGKPKDRKDAEKMLFSLQNRMHRVITGIALYNRRKNSIDSRTVTSKVSFAPISKEEIEWYLNSGEWEDAAGSYRIQGLASCFVKSIKGSYSSIVGLPLREFYVMLKANGYPMGS
ncbi:MAG: Maf family protein [Treponema sp.]|nr:Maf family protein [Treponema sp.]